MPTVVDFFCGMGGSSTGLARAGYDVKVAANHWDRAIETHSANHPNTEHLCADISAIDLRHLPKTDVLWASPICTEISPAGGRRRRGAQAELFEDHGYVSPEAFTRTRVTFWEVIRAAEIFRYDVVLIENVVEAAEWELFETWLTGMSTLGYEHQFVSVSAAHIGGEGNPHAPQWRDRLYIVLNRRGMRRPDVEPRPLAHCDTCGHDIEARQWWKREGRHIGKYRAQYVYVCPEPSHGVVEPYVAPAASAIDWSNIGTKIGDRPRPLAAGTMRRIRRGLEFMANEPSTFTMSHGSNGAHMPAWSAPMRTFTTKATDALMVPPMVVAAAGNTWDSASRGLDHGYLRAWPVTKPLPPQTTTASHGLVIPFRRGAVPYPASDGPLSTTATKSQHGVMLPAPDVEDCYFRMLLPREAANAQAFPGDYIIKGNQGEQQKQAGNAVAVNVACWLGQQVTHSLDQKATAA